MITWTIYDWLVAPVALVYGSAHWIVVRGYTASHAPSSPADTSYSICAFDVNNPWPPTPSPGPPPPHADNTDGCGTGGSRGVTDEHISYNEWRSTYMTGVPGGYWAGKFVAVCDPAPPPDLPGRTTQEPPGFVREIDRLLNRGEVLEGMKQAIELSCLLENPWWENLLNAVEFDRPVLVQRLDTADDYYWVVPAAGGERSAYLSIDARRGTFRQAIALPAGASSGLTGAEIREPSNEELAEELTGKLRDVCDLREQIVVRPEALSVHPALVWRPCRESMSPFAPFRMITIGDHRLFLRILDGALFTSLTVGERGL
jgi:hypothetical protein